MADEAENLAIAQAGYAAFARGDLEAALEPLADDVEWIVPGTSAVSGVHTGRDEVAELLGRLAERGWDVEPEYWFADGDHVCVLSGVRVGGEDMDVADLLTFAAGRVTKFQAACDTELLKRVFG